MIYYNYDHETGVYLGTTGEAKECQREPGVFHYPAWTTPVAPPEQEGMTAYYVNGNWALGPKTREETVVAALGQKLTPEEKIHTLHDVAYANIDRAAVHFGFKSMADALTYCGEESQRGYNADALKVWRGLAMAAVDEMIKKVASSTDALPTHDEWNHLFHSIPFQRKIVPIPTVYPEGAERHMAPAELYSLLEEASRIEELTKIKT